MEQKVIRDCVLAERLERGLADYHARRTSGESYPDLRSPAQRNSIESLRVQRLSEARHFVAALRN